MNAVTPKPILQAALLIFTLISSLFCHRKSNHKGHTQKIHAWPCLRQQELRLLSVQGHAHPQTEGTHMLHQQKGISGKQTSWRGPGLFKALNNTGRGSGRSRLLPSPPHPSIICPYRSQAPILHAPQNISVNDKMSEVSYLLGPAQGMSLGSSDSHLQDTLLFLQH